MKVLPGCSNVISSNATQARVTSFISRSSATPRLLEPSSHHASARSYVVEYRPTQRYVQSLFEEELTWEGSGTSRAHFGPTEYRFFRIHGDVRHCVGFSATSGVTYEDARERAHDLVYGYFCSQGLTPITGADAERYIGSVLIKN